LLKRSAHLFSRVAHAPLFAALGLLASCGTANSPPSVSPPVACSPDDDLPEAPSCVMPARAVEPSLGRSATNVDGAPLATCSTSPMTGVYRDGRCATGPDDFGVHVVCAQVNEAFLNFTVAQGNDLVTPSRGFPGLRAGDRWCLCASRWAEANAAGAAPPVVIEATEAAALRIIPRADLDAHALQAAP